MIVRRNSLAGLAIMAMGTVAGCGSEQPAPAAAPPVAAAPVAAPAPIRHSKEEDVAKLTAIANEDFAAARYFSPPTANALEGFLAVRKLDPDNAGVREAIAELFPLAADGAQAALDAGTLDEAQRIIDLLDRAAPDALGLADLKTQLARLREPPAAPEPAVAGPPDPAPDAPAEGAGKLHDAADEPAATALPPAQATAAPARG